MLRLTATYTDGSGLLRRALHANAAFSLLTGLALLAGAGPVADLLGLHPAISMPVGAGLIVFALSVRAISLLRAIPDVLPVLVIAGDAAWVAGSIVVIALPGLGITIAGTLLIAVVAEIVGGFAIAQALALRRKRRFAHAAATG
jgi:hypothetical protein